MYIFIGVVKILKTFITKLPDKAGEFLGASRIIFESGGKIKRVSYNKMVDAHTLFVDISAREEDIEKIEKELYEKGYLSYRENSRVILMSINLPCIEDEILKPLELIEKYKMSISYINARENKENSFVFKLGIKADNISYTVDFLNEMSRICDVKIIKNDVTEKNIDNTVFYISFAHDMRKILNLNQSDTNSIIVNSNKIMQRLEERNENPFKTFEYIKKVALFIENHKGKNFDAKIFSKNVNGKKLYLIEPPCGSNTFVIEDNGKLLFIDSGFACFEEEMLKILRDLFENFEKYEKILFLTHCDIDHIGLCHIFDKVYVSRKTYENFVLEKNGERNFREQCEHHRAYHAITKIISGYKTPPINNMVISKKLKLSGAEFKIIPGGGGHVPGESLLLWEDEKIVFCGDIFVNAMGYSDGQAEFNSYAPYLTGSVNVDSQKALEERYEFMKKYKGFLVCPGHGKWCVLQ